MSEDPEVQYVIENHTDDGPGDMEDIPEENFISYATEGVEDE
jgi:hypothetical protein